MSNTRSHPLGSPVVPGSCGCSSCGTQTHPEWTPQWWSSPPGEGTDKIPHRSHSEALTHRFMQESSIFFRDVSQTLKHKQLHRPHHGHYVEGHEVQPAPVARHRSDSFLWESEHGSSQTATRTDQWRDCRAVSDERPQINDLILPWWCTSYWPQSVQTESLEK